jgi:hypothetical protein
MWKQVRTRHGLSTAFVAALAVAAFAASTSGAQAASPCRAYVNTARGPFEGVVYRNVNASCPFARNVAAASMRVIVRAGGVGNGSFSTRAYSPVTHKLYRVRCDANGSLYTSERISVDCRAGIRARVLFRAWSY